MMIPRVNTSQQRVQLNSMNKVTLQGPLQAKIMSNYLKKGRKSINNKKVSFKKNAKN